MVELKWECLDERITAVTLMDAVESCGRTGIRNEVVCERNRTVM